MAKCNDEQGFRLSNMYDAQNLAAVSADFLPRVSLGVPGCGRIGDSSSEAMRSDSHFWPGTACFVNGNDPYFWPPDHMERAKKRESVRNLQP